MDVVAHPEHGQAHQDHSHQDRHDPEPDDGPPAVRTDGLTRTFGDHVSVDHLDLTVPGGTVFGFIGPSGCGKTTTVRLLTGLLRPSEGRATVLGRSPGSFTRRDRRRFGYMPQQNVLYPDLSIEANVRFAMRIYGVRHDRAARVQRALEFVELSGHARKRLSLASGGMQRRAALAATLAHDPELLFLDEPTAGLDPVLRTKLWDHFRLLRDEGRTLFVTTQHLDEATRCDVVGLMVAGRMVALGPPAELRRQALGGDVVRARTTSIIDAATQERLRSLPGVTRASVAPETPTTVEVVGEDAGATMVAVLDVLGPDLGIEAIEHHVPPFDDVFVTLVARAAEGDPTPTDG